MFNVYLVNRDAQQVIAYDMHHADEIEIERNEWLAIQRTMMMAGG